MSRGHPAQGPVTSSLQVVVPGARRTAQGEDPLDVDQPKIEDYAFISDSHAPALLSREGSVEWWCPPQADAPPVFGRLLDPDGGHWSLTVEGSTAVERRYLPDSLVLETRITTPTGEARRSALVLQGLTYQPSGAVLAAATTSLPADFGGDVNWDYRYAWLRDLSLTSQALAIAACPDEPERYLHILADAAGEPESGARVQIMYAVDGRRYLPESELDHLAGFRGSTPVRVGNAAWDQAQLDVMGEVLDMAHRFADQLDPLDERVRRLLLWLADEAAGTWEFPDAGMWEARDQQRQYLTSKVTCWVALDRALDLADRLGAEAHVERWEAERDRIREAVLREGWNDEVGAYTGAFGSDRLDASVLLLPLVGFLPADDERMAATIRLIADQLVRDGLVYRWDGDTNGFVLCTYWLVECLALCGELDRAAALFDQVTDHASELGLFAEQIDPATGEHSGNFPQAFSHVGLINAAWRLDTLEQDGARAAR